MLIKLNSTNQDMSWVIQKNPESISAGRQIRQGVGIGYFTDPTEYKLVFVDGVDECSYPSYVGEFAYLQPNEYVHPQCALNLLAEFLHTATTKPNDKDTVGNQKLTIESLIVRDRTVETFNNYFQNFRINWEPLRWPDYKRIEITHDGTIRDLLMYTNVFLLVAMMDKHLWFDRSSDLIGKYINMLVELDVPYFIRYLFKYYLLVSEKEFNKYQAKLEKSNNNNYEFCYGSNQRCRERWVKENLSGNTILDVGCGEGNFFQLAKKVSEYHAVDIDPEVLEIAARKAKNYKNISTYSNLSEVPDIGECDIILSEVIEHIALYELDDFMCSLNKFNWQRIIITTPNNGFNENYLLDDEEFRHKDHKWENNNIGVYHTLLPMYDKLGITMEMHDIGDKVNGISTTTGIIITRTGEY